MRTRLFALSALAAASALTSAPTPAYAREYPWCAQYSERVGGGRNCGFVTFQQCLATVSGAGGTCEPNPRYADGRERRHRREERRYYRD
jgi:hypothetical protein